MATSERITVTLPAEVVERIDRLVKNRSRFVAQAIEHELASLRRAELLRSLSEPHDESLELAESGLEEWADQLSAAAESLLDVSMGTPIRWVPGQGWTEGEP
ncbi:MAG TPA: ribbon-helix-helix domain-containing protein [Trueperaceae bacterium]|nr:ribbon-helix-helix domain-containing protein [Trueperaceae bacterium]